MRLVRPAFPTPGFTLAELLIALAILGVIATFTIPKVLQAQQDQRWNSGAKEVAGNLSTALKIALINKGKAGSTVVNDITPYLNYVKIVTDQSVDEWQDGNTHDCSVTQCLLLHNGAILYASGVNSFGGMATTNALPWYYDPDGKVTDGTTNGPGKSLVLYLYYNGLVRTSSSRFPNTCDAGQCWTAPAADPPWFSWN